MSKQTYRLYRYYKHTVESNNSKMQCSTLKLITLPICVIFIIKQLELPLKYSMIFRCAKQARFDGFPTANFFFWGGGLLCLPNTVTTQRELIST